MKVVVTGGTGMIGRKLISSLLATPELIDRDGNKSEVTSITAFDVMPPDPPLPDDDRLSVVTGEISNAEAIASLICDDTDAVFHLAAVVSAQAEEDFDLGMRVNLDGTRIVLERCRALEHAPRVVYASSVAAFGGEMPDVIDDTVTPNPQTTYGVTKVIGEYLIDDYSRKGFIDGRALRLPTIVVRPGRPNKAASTWASSIMREPLAGHSAVCPVTEDSKMWMLSPRRVVEAFRHAQVLDSDAWGPSPSGQPAWDYGFCHRVPAGTIASRWQFRASPRVLRAQPVHPGYRRRMGQHVCNPTRRRHGIYRGRRSRRDRFCVFGG